MRIGSGRSADSRGSPILRRNREIVCHAPWACATRATMTEEQQRIRSYLLAQGLKLTPAAIVEKVQAAIAATGASRVFVTHG